MQAPFPSPVAAGTSGGSLSGMTTLTMFKQSLTRPRIPIRNDPAGTREQV